MGKAIQALAILTVAFASPGVAAPKFDSLSFALPVGATAEVLQVPMLPDHDSLRAVITPNPNSTPTGDACVLGDGNGGSHDRTIIGASKTARTFMIQPYLAHTGQPVHQMTLSFDPPAQKPTAVTVKLKSEPLIGGTGAFQEISVKVTFAEGANSAAADAVFNSIKGSAAPLLPAKKDCLAPAS